MDLQQKIRSIPASPGVYLYKNAEGEVIYVGKAKSLRHRVSSYFHEGRVADAKTGTLVREAVDVDYIVVANNKEALALENHLIKQKQPRFNILLRDDKTYPYVKLTLADRYPRVYVTRRLKKDGSVYYGPYFPANLAYRIVDLIHRSFLVPSCNVDLNRFHPRPCLQFYIGRCLGPCVEGLTTAEIYQEAVRDVKLFLDGQQAELGKSLRERMARAADAHMLLGQAPGQRVHARRGSRSRRQEQQPREQAHPELVRRERGRILDRDADPLAGLTRELHVRPRGAPRLGRERPCLEAQAARRIPPVYHE